MEKNQEGITAKREENFSEWFTQIVQKTELADLRYNVKGFLVFQPWSVLSMEKMYEHMEKNLQNKGHEPYFFPTLIPEENLKKESSHIGGFTPEVFWVTHGGEKKFEERLALRPTSETAFYEMYGLGVTKIYHLRLINEHRFLDMKQKLQDLFYEAGNFIGLKDIQHMQQKMMLLSRFWRI